MSLRMLSEHAHELTTGQRADVHEATEAFIDTDMALHGFRRVEDLRELFPAGDVPSAPNKKGRNLFRSSGPLRLFREV
jgi:hypothetical protein